MNPGLHRVVATHRDPRTGVLLRGPFSVGVNPTDLRTAEIVRSKFTPKRMRPRGSRPFDVSYEILPASAPFTTIRWV